MTSDVIIIGAGIIGAACAMMRDIHARGAGEAFDLFLLSDTTRADVWLDEQALVRTLAGILRVAIGLDRCHEHRVAGVRVGLRPRTPDSPEGPNEISIQH